MKEQKPEKRICSCPEKSKSVSLRNWEVTQYKVGNQAICGGRFMRKRGTRSSELKCNECNAVWRTSAAYVEAVRSYQSKRHYKLV